MKTKKRWFRIYVECRSTERFDVEATSEEEAVALYEAGKAELCQDQVESRTISEIDDAGKREG